MSRFRKYAGGLVACLFALGILLVMRNADTIGRIISTVSSEMTYTTSDQGEGGTAATRLPSDILPETIQSSDTAGDGESTADTGMAVAQTDDDLAGSSPARADLGSDSQEFPEPRLPTPEGTDQSASPPSLSESKAPAPSPADGRGVQDAPLAGPDRPEDCGVMLGTNVVVAALLELVITETCVSLSRVEVSHEGLIFSVVTNDSGIAEVMVPALSEEAVIVATMGGDIDATVRVRVPDVVNHDRAVLQWQGLSGPELHALEFGAKHGEPGHIWHDAPGEAGVTTARTAGFLLRLGDGEGPDPLVAEVYSFPVSASFLEGEIELLVETPVTEGNCGQEISARAIHVPPGEGSRVSDLTLDVPACDFIGQFVIVRDVFPVIRVPGG